MGFRSMRLLNKSGVGRDSLTLYSVRKKHTGMQKRWALGFLGLLGIIGIVGIIHSDWLQSIWIAWFAFFSYFLPEKKAVQDRNE